ncbi:MAG TPA: hypothetical protein VMV71_00045 [Candidatus Paceibacterota bacterium]|nr:hypothetical protein [Candidatus Paceibacterota bacterium]
MSTTATVAPATNSVPVPAEKADSRKYWFFAVVFAMAVMMFGVGGGKKDYITCPDTAKRIEASVTTVIEVPLHPKCKSGWIHLPYGFKGYLDTGINKEFEVWFLDGRHILAPAGKPVDFGDNPNNRDFQVRGDEGMLRIEPGA